MATEWAASCWSRQSGLQKPATLRSSSKPGGRLAMTSAPVSISRTARPSRRIGAPIVKERRPAVKKSFGVHFIGCLEEQFMAATRAADVHPPYQYPDYKST